MIDFHYETDFQINEEHKYVDWVSRVVASEDRSIKQLDYVFCSDNFLWELNKKHLNHDTFTDIITFDYSEEIRVSGDIFISIDRVIENAETYGTEFHNELLRVMSHGLLHLMGYNDKSNSDKSEMSAKENEKIKMFHVEQ